jgi:hypothetical protein
MFFSFVRSAPLRPGVFALRVLKNSYLFYPGNLASSFEQDYITPDAVQFAGSFASSDLTKAAAFVHSYARRIFREYSRL